MQQLAWENDISVYKCVPAVYYGKCATSGCYSRQRLLNDDITSLEGSINLQEKSSHFLKWISCKYSSLLEIWLFLRDLDVPDIYFATKGVIEGAFPGVAGSSRVAAVIASSAGF